MNSKNQNSQNYNDRHNRNRDFGRTMSESSHRNSWNLGNDYRNSPSSDYSADYTNQSQNLNQHHEHEDQNQFHGRDYGSEQNLGYSNRDQHSQSYENQGRDSLANNRSNNPSHSMNYSSYGQSRSNYGAQDYNRDTQQRYGNFGAGSTPASQYGSTSYGTGYGNAGTGNLGSRYNLGSESSSYYANSLDQNKYSGDVEGRQSQQWNRGWQNDSGINTWASNTNSSSQYNQDRTQGGKHAGIGPKNYKRADTRIQEDVCDALSADSHIDASEIDVTVKSGVVTLTGSVSEKAMKRFAEDCAEKINGVTDVRNELTTQSSQHTKEKNGIDAQSTKSKSNSNMM